MNQPESPLTPPGRVELGLLEQPVLVLRREGDGWRLLTDRGEAVGAARWRYRPWWRGWPTAILEVREEVQGPLVCTIRRQLALWARREVRDAESELVGVVAGRWLLDRWGNVAMRRRGGELLDERDAVLATVQAARLEFRPLVQQDPFAKMLLLAAVLTSR